MKRALACMVVLAACRAPHGEPLRNVAPPGALVIPPSQPLGWLGLAPALSADSELPTYTPAHATYPLVVAPPLSVAPETRLFAIGATGALATYIVAPPGRLPFGCDGNTLDVTPFLGRRMAPGVAWILPPDPPTGWRPRALDLHVLGSAPARARFGIGPLEVDLIRMTDTKGALRVTRAGKRIHTQTFARVPIDGAPPDTETLDLTQLDSPGIQYPIGAWSIAPDGPILIAFHTPGWEGSNLSALLVENERTRTVDAMSTYLYRCAF